MTLPTDPAVVRSCPGTSGRRAHGNLPTLADLVSRHHTGHLRGQGLTPYPLQRTGWVRVMRIEVPPFNIPVSFNDPAYGISLPSFVFLILATYRPKLSLD